MFKDCSLLFEDLFVTNRIYNFVRNFDLCFLLKWFIYWNKKTNAMFLLSPILKWLGCGQFTIPLRTFTPKRKIGKLKVLVAEKTMPQTSTQGVSTYQRLILINNIIHIFWIIILEASHITYFHWIHTTFVVVDIILW